VARHAEGIETIGSPEQELLVLAVGVILVKMVLQVMSLLVL